MIRRITAITAVTWTELVRLKVFYFLIIFALLVIGNSFFLARFSFEEEFQMLKDIALGAMSVFSSLLAILATATLLPKDIEDRTIYTVLAKPVSRTEYLLGKLSGVFLLLALAVLLMGAVFAAVLLLRTQTLLHSAQIEMAALPPAELQAALDKIRATGYDPNLLAGGVVILVKAWLLAALTMFISTFATSTIFTTITAFAAYFIGHLQATARDYWLAADTSGLLTKSVLAIVSLVFPDLQAFNLVDDIVTGVAIPTAIFWKTLALGAGYIAVYTALAAAVFHQKEL
ncbi:MAG: ABC transporter permease subunit [Verrucomicrobia bacterium]|jgi:ABC-2 type transport system permease protein|nr:ABC transporter permease subunit [Verrucomicrobiota bacterium]MDA1203720.1 ABC transporter permease subunit [Verrucomicrobiota bacterium]